jgi:micrococcal nuclease
MPTSAARAAVLATLTLVAVGCSRPSTRQPVEAAGVGVVTHPVDGDTVDVRIAGQEERVRLIGIDTPESVSDDVPVECFGPEAKVRLAELIPEGTQVRLERDVEARDRYGRLLAYVIRTSDDLHVNRALVEEGFAEARSFEPNTARQAELDAAEADARREQRGLWPVCGDTDQPASPTSGSPVASSG